MPCLSPCRPPGRRALPALFSCPAARDRGKVRPWRPAEVSTLGQESRPAVVHPVGRIWARRSIPARGGGNDNPGISRPPPFRRLALIPASAPGDPVRRYRLARLEDIAFGSPSDSAPAPGRTHAPPLPPGKERGDRWLS